MQAARGAAVRQLRTALRHPNNDIFSRTKLTDEEKEESFARRQPLPDDMPRLPMTFNNGDKRGPSGKPWATEEERAQYRAELDAWVKKAHAEGRVLTDRGGEAIKHHPTDNDEAHKAFLEGEFAAMSAEEKMLKGHTVDEARAKPYHEFYDHEIVRPAFQAVWLRPQKVPMKNNFRRGMNMTLIMVDPDGNLPDGAMRSTYVALETNVPDYRAELADILGKRKEAREARDGVAADAAASA